MYFKKGDDYLNAYCRLTFETWYEGIKSDITKETIIDSKKSIISVLMDIYKGGKGKYNITLDGELFESVYDKEKAITDILEFLAANENTSITYAISYEKHAEYDEIINEFIKYRLKYDELILDRSVDDYLLFVGELFSLDDVHYIKVYPDGSYLLVKLINRVLVEKKGHLDEKLFKKVYKLAKQKSEKRNKMSYFCGEMRPNRAYSYYRFGFKLFNQSREDYMDDDVDFYETTNIDALDKVIMMTDPSFFHKRIVLGESESYGDFQNMISNTLGEVATTDNEETIFDSYRPKNNGKELCEKLRNIRKNFVNESGLKFKFTECTYEGKCAGTCPLCDKEAREIADLAREAGIIK